MITLRSERVNPPKFEKYILPNFVRRNAPDVERIGNIIIFHLTKLRKAKFSILRGVIFLVRLQGKLELEHSKE